jgi:hypothetical protein
MPISITNNTICPSCDIFKIEEPVLNTKRANWLSEKNHSKEFIIKTPIKIKKQAKYDFTKTINIGAINSKKMVLYWASERSTDGDNNVKDAQQAYGEFANHGVAIVNKFGNFKIYLNVPQNYSDYNKTTNKDEIYFKHMHFVLSDERKTTWNTNQVYTYLLTPEYNFQSFIKLIKLNNTIVINTSNPHDYSVKHIPNTYNLPFNKLYDMNYKEFDEWLLKTIKINYPSLKSTLQNFTKQEISQLREKIHTLPIVIYSNDKKDALNKYTENLINGGYVNVCVFNGGMSEYNKNKKSNKIYFKTNNIPLKKRKKRKYYSLKKN